MPATEGRTGSSPTPTVGKYTARVNRIFFDGAREPQPEKPAAKPLDSTISPGYPVLTSEPPHHLYLFHGSFLSSCAGHHRLHLPSRRPNASPGTRNLHRPGASPGRGKDPATGGSGSANPLNDSLGPSRVGQDDARPSHCSSFRAPLHRL